MSAVGDRVVVPARGASVRMYNAGLGECLLVTFAGDDGTPRHALIDCGTARGTPAAADRMVRIVADVGRVTGGRIDVLVVTHPHWDRLSGFLSARAQFRGISVGRVWLSWLEDPSNALARSLFSTHRNKLARLETVEQRLEREQLRAETEGRRADAGRVARTADVLREALDEAAETGRRTSSSEQAMEVVRQLVAAPEYHGPGGPFKFPGASSVNVYVLGPPTDVHLLRQIHPPRDTGKIKPLEGAARPRQGVKSDVEGGGLFDRGVPFDSRYTHRPDSPGGAFVRRLYEDPAQSWRRIDSDWLGAAGRIARNLDAAANNGSLVLAFELGTGGPILLFPGDAQFGNWMSWDSVSFHGADAADLLARTVLYKVSHHGGHLGTPKACLERMTRPDLVAMISVDEAEARKPKAGLRTGWDMPYPPLLRQLIERTRGRVMRTDTGVPLLDRNSRPAGWSQPEWEEFKRDTAVVRDKDDRPFYVQYTVRPDR